MAISVGKSGELVDEITAASHEHTQGIEQVNAAVNEMNTVVQQNAANAEESASASEEMNAQAELMRVFVKDLIALVGRIETKGIQDEPSAAKEGGLAARNMHRNSSLFLKKRLECDAIGIRLKEDEDYPYFETTGFSEDFILRESSLCAGGGQRQTFRCPDDGPLLECFCGAILSGRFDASKPCFTEHGSF